MKKQTRSLHPARYVKRMIVHPVTGKRLARVKVAGRWFQWNTVYRVYNAVDNYGQLQQIDLNKVEFNA